MVFGFWWLRVVLRVMVVGLSRGLLVDGLVTLLVGGFLTAGLYLFVGLAVLDFVLFLFRRLLFCVLFCFTVGIAIVLVLFGFRVLVAGDFGCRGSLAGGLGLLARWAWFGVTLLIVLVCALCLGLCFCFVDALVGLFVYGCRLVIVRCCVCWADWL